MATASNGIKLFGATITLQDRKGKDGSSERIEQEMAAEMKRPDKIIPCPRCKSMETKFCYFNNYNVNQPRHYCKGCQRYWTAGGALRNVPVGAGRRKNKPLCRAELAGFRENMGAGMYEASDADQQYFDLDGVAAAAETWQLMAAQRAFRQVLPVPPLKRLRNGMIGGHQS